MQPPIALTRNRTVHIAALSSVLALACLALQAKDEFAPRTPWFERPEGIAQMLNSIDSSNMYLQCPGQLWVDSTC